MNRVLILRPEPAAGRTAAKAAALGLDVRVHPLFAPRPFAWTPPPASQFDALLLTSAHGVRLAGPGLTAYRGLPTYAVGEATAQALRDADFADVVAGAGDGSAIASRAAADGHRRLLHLGGTTVAPMAAAIDVTRVAVYSMIALPPDPALVADAAPGSVLLVHSPRAGERLAARILPDGRAALHIVAISPAALAACGAGWASGQAAARPVDDEMLALAARLCE
ncbi:uroporphyrinogen-III synthase [Sphingobium cupriresistens]|uniref:Uroporphyrinogen-III synthase n=1 Tax=Sphingobium cupriresistens LL01 TaxID=1420583 RepID=A0A0J7XPW8_9SPHN|nr:uroporphyrinogen-III synthase [Sphingobium cupriresistens]KMS53996.1 uroporphyrinogen-III synthase [Sphingobium cupriresistens LL01]